MPKTNSHKDNRSLLTKLRHAWNTFSGKRSTTQKRFFGGNTSTFGNTVFNPMTQGNVPVGGAADRMRRSWYSGFYNSPNVDTQRNLIEDRRLSRFLCELDGYAGNYLELLETYVVGDNGIRFVPQVKYTMGPKAGELNDKVNKALIEMWEDWSKCATTDGQLSWIEVEGIGIKTVAQDGELFVRHVMGKDLNKYGYALQLIDPALLDINMRKVIDKEHIVYQAIELGKHNRPEAYWVYTRYLDDQTFIGERSLDRIPAEEIVHLYKTKYPDQLRGRPWLLKVLYTLARIHEYQDSVLVSAQTAANVPFIVESQADDETDVLSNPTAIADVDSQGNLIDEPEQEQPNDQWFTLQQNNILVTPPGKKVVVPDFHLPSQNFPAAMKVFLRALAAGLHVNYSSLTADASDANYSSGRLGSIVERDHFQKLQAWYSTKFHMKVYRALLESAILTGSIQLPTDDPDDYMDVDWRPRNFQWIDPEKDNKGDIIAVNAGFKTKTQVCRESYGTDYEDNCAERAREIEIEKKYGLDVAPLPINDPTQGKPLVQLEQADQQEAQQESQNAPKKPPTDLSAEDEEEPPIDNETGEPKKGKTAGDNQDEAEA